MKHRISILLAIITSALLIFVTSCNPDVPSPTLTVAPTATAEPTAPPWPSIGIIAFERIENFIESNIYIINTDGTGLKKIVDGPGDFIEHPNWSPDGNKITFMSGFRGIGSYTVWAINSDGINQVQLTQLPLGGVFPAWSLDGNKIAFSATPRPLKTPMLKIHIINSAGNNLSVLTSGEGEDIFPTWAPNGTILFLRKLDGLSGGIGDVFAVNPDGTGLVQLTTVGHIVSYALSPDGTKIAYHDYAKKQIMIIPLYTSGPPLTLIEKDLYTGCMFFALSWSPDGKALAMACSSLESLSGSDLYIIHTDGSGYTTIPNAGKALDPSGSVLDPSWRPK